MSWIGRAPPGLRRQRLLAHLGLDPGDVVRDLLPRHQLQRPRRTTAPNGGVVRLHQVLQLGRGPLGRQQLPRRRTAQLGTHPLAERPRVGGRQHLPVVVVQQQPEPDQPEGGVRILLHHLAEQHHPALRDDFAVQRALGLVRQPDRHLRPLRASTSPV
ncbi:hypothetical protein ACFQ2M_21440 [Kitasatospora saccharophila]|uniref:hypothetical protein n=1 Tax=Kitasatospora saccharophila TaxID=407973 RepID=UPI003632CEF6